MRTNITPNSVTIWLSAKDTYNWAHKPGATWPCSTLSDKRLVATFDTSGLCDLIINGRLGRLTKEIDCHELSAMVSDFLKPVLTLNHPCRFVTVSQYREG